MSIILGFICHICSGNDLNLLISKQVLLKDLQKVLSVGKSVFASFALGISDQSFLQIFNTGHWTSYSSFGKV